MNKKEAIKICEEDTIDYTKLINKLKEGAKA